MKKTYLIGYLVSFCLCMISIIFRNHLNILDKVFVFLAVALFLFTFLRYCTSKAPRCPNCNAVIYSGHIRNVARQRDGVIPCEKCGSLVRVNHSSQR